MTMHGWMDKPLDNWVAGVCGDATLVVLVSAHLNVAFHSPRLAPAKEIKKMLELNSHF